MSDLVGFLRDAARHTYREWTPEKSEYWLAADALEAKDKLIDELVEASASAAQRLRYCGDLWHDQGLQARAEADWEASDRLNLLISKAQS